MGLLGLALAVSAAVLLGFVTFGVPYYKVIFLLKASINDSADGFNGSLLLGTFGYCLALTNGTVANCTKASFDYQLKNNSLAVNNLPIQLPVIAEGWVITALLANVVAFIAAVVSVITFSLSYSNKKITIDIGIAVTAAFITLVAFAMDLTLFLEAKNRINGSSFTSASLGSAFYFAGSAMLVLLASGIFDRLGGKKKSDGTGQSNGS